MCIVSELWDYMRGGANKLMKDTKTESAGCATRAFSVSNAYHSTTKCGLAWVSEKVDSQPGGGGFRQACRWHTEIVSPAFAIAVLRTHDAWHEPAKCDSRPNEASMHPLCIRKIIPTQKKGNLLLLWGKNKKPGYPAGMRPMKARLIPRRLALIPHRLCTHSWHGKQICCVFVLVKKAQVVKVPVFPPNLLARNYIRF